MYKNGFGINNLQWLMCRKSKENQTKRKCWVHMICHCILIIRLTVILTEHITTGE